MANRLTCVVVNCADRDQDAELQRTLDLGTTTADVGQTGEESRHVLDAPERGAHDRR